MQWTQIYDPLGHWWLSTLVAALPIIVLFGMLAGLKVKPHWCAIAGASTAVAVAIVFFKMPPALAAISFGYGVAFGALKIAWIVLAAVYLYDISVETGQFEIMKESVAGITPDRRLQVLLVAFCFGALIEGAAGFGAPVAIAGAFMIGLGFKPFHAAALNLIANTAPVAWGAIGTPVHTLAAVTALPESDLNAMIGRILPILALLLPFWLVCTMTNWASTLEVWPGLLICGGVAAAIQFYWSNFQDSALVDIVGGMTTLVALALFFRIWKPKTVWRYLHEPAAKDTPHSHSGFEILHAWSPFLLMAALVIVWGMPVVKKILDPTTLSIPVPGLHMQVVRVPPVVDKVEYQEAKFDLAWLSSVGTATFLAGLLSGPILGMSLRRTLEIFFRTCYRMRFSMAAILAMLGLGFVTRYSGMDAVMGLAMTHTGRLYPFFGTLLGWLGVALTGTDAGSNALFGSLQVITANRLGLSPVLMAAANSAGGVMGKMISAESIIVACAAVGEEGKEGDLFRAVLPHSIVLAALVGLIVYFFSSAGQAWVPAGRVWGH